MQFSIKGTRASTQPLAISELTLSSLVVQRLKGAFTRTPTRIPMVSSISHNRKFGSKTNNIMAKDWGMYKDEIAVLYVHRGYTPEKLRKTMSTKYGFDAS